MTRDEYIERLLAYVRDEGPSPLHRKQEYQERDFYSRVQVRSGDEGGHLSRDWTGSSFGGRVFGGGKWSGGRDV